MRVLLMSLLGLGLGLSGLVFAEPLALKQEQSKALASVSSCAPFKTLKDELVASANARQVVQHSEACGLTITFETLQKKPSVKSEFNAWMFNPYVASFELTKNKANVDLYGLQARIGDADTQFKAFMTPDMNGAPYVRGAPILIQRVAPSLSTVAGAPADTITLHFDASHQVNRMNMKLWGH